MFWPAQECHILAGQNITAVWTVQTSRDIFDFQTIKFFGYAPNVAFFGFQNGAGQNVTVFAVLQNVRFGEPIIQTCLAFEFRNVSLSESRQSVLFFELQNVSLVEHKKCQVQKNMKFRISEKRDIVSSQKKC